LEINPDDEDTWYNKGITLDNLEKYDEAIICYNEVIRLNPEYLDVWREKGDVLVKLGKYDKARKCFDISQRRQEG